MGEDKYWTSMKNAVHCERCDQKPKPEWWGLCKSCSKELQEKLAKAEAEKTKFIKDALDFLTKAKAVGVDVSEERLGLVVFNPRAEAAEKKLAAVREWANQRLKQYLARELLEIIGDKEGE